MSNDVKFAYNNGYNSASAGIAITLNPHNKTETVLYDAWNKGHADASYLISQGEPVAQ